MFWRCGFANDGKGLLDRFAAGSYWS